MLNSVLYIPIATEILFVKQKQYRMSSTLLLIFSIACSFLLSACFYKIDVQQGNIVTQKMVDKLKQGMPKSKVRFVMGTPLLKDIFDAQRWDYYYSDQPGGKDLRQHRISLIFTDDTLQAIEGDMNLELKAGDDEILLDNTVPLL